MFAFSIRNLARYAVLASAATMLPTAEAASSLPATPTIRAMAGAQPIDHLDPKTTALVVIDFQNEYLNGRMPIAVATNLTRTLRDWAMNPRSFSQSSAGCRSPTSNRRWPTRSA